MFQDFYRWLISTTSTEYPQTGSNPVINYKIVRTVELTVSWQAKIFLTAKRECIQQTWRSFHVLSGSLKFSKKSEKNLFPYQFFFLERFNYKCFEWESLTLLKVGRLLVAFGRRSSAWRFDCSLITGSGYLGKCLCPDHILSLVSFLLLLIFSDIKVTEEGKKWSIKEIRCNPGNLSKNYRQVVPKCYTNVLEWVRRRWVLMLHWSLLICL